MEIIKESEYRCIWASYKARIRYSRNRIKYSKPILNQPRRKEHQVQPTRYHRRLVFRFQSKSYHLEEGLDDLQE